MMILSLQIICRSKEVNVISITSLKEEVGVMITKSKGK